MRLSDKVRNPRVARLIGYIIFFLSLPFFGAAMFCINIAGGILSMLFLVLGAACFAASTIWMMRKVRCPHCNALLHLKLYDISRCPYCHKSTDPDDVC